MLRDPAQDRSGSSNHTLASLRHSSNNLREGQLSNLHQDAVSPHVIRPGCAARPSTVATAAKDTLTDKDQLLLVYCRSGNRSKLASQALADLGYSNVIEFGGINSWPYNIER